MKKYILKLQNELIKLRKFKTLIKNNFKKSPEGSVYVVSKKDKLYYHHQYYKNGKRIKKYIKSENLKLAKSLAQKSYEKNTIRKIDKQIDIIEKFLENYKNNLLEDEFKALSPEKRALVTPLEPTWELLVKQWRQSSKMENSYPIDTTNYRTKNGEFVRSKSEIIIANALYDANIPYRYEAGIYLDGYGNISPDFTILEKDTGKLIYWEHFGRMNELDYVRKTINKINAYNLNGLKLILTFETESNPLNIDIVTTYINRIADCDI